MDENKRTIIFVAVAVGLALVAWVVTPGKIRPEAFDDQGEPFFPEFNDPNIATSLEVIEYNKSSGEAVPFRVVTRNNLWSIPSHYDYPADGKDRLAKTAAGMISIRRDDFRTRNATEYAICGVIDPLDQTFAGLTGKGRRVSVRGPNEKLLADLIIGNDVPGRPGFRFVRVPNEKGVYAAKVDMEISTQFVDWIETDLLLVDMKKIDLVVIDDYSVNERTLSIDKVDEIELTLKGNNWIANGMKSNSVVDSVTMQNLLKAIDELSIVGVRPKPSGLSEQLAGTETSMSMSQSDVHSLQRKGFFFSTAGQMLSNEGELHASTSDGVTYILRFGEVVYGSGLSITAGSNSDVEEASGKGENRYLFVTTQANTERFIEPPQEANQEFLGKPDSLWTDSDKANNSAFVKRNNWKQKVKNAENRSAFLNTRFSGWYYVISAASFDDLHLSRKELVVKRSDS